MDKDEIKNLDGEFKAKLQKQQVLNSIKTYIIKISICCLKRGREAIRGSFPPLTRQLFCVSAFPNAPQRFLRISVRRYSFAIPDLPRPSAPLLYPSSARCRRPDLSRNRAISTFSEYNRRLRRKQPYGISKAQIILQLFRRTAVYHTVIEHNGRAKKRTRAVFSVLHGIGHIKFLAQRASCIDLT